MTDDEDLHRLKAHMASDLDMSVYARQPDFPSHEQTTTRVVEVASK